MAACARQVLLRAADERIASRRAGPSIGATEGSAVAPNTSGQSDAAMPKPDSAPTETAGEDRTRALLHVREEVSQHVDQLEVLDFLNEIYHLGKENLNHLAIDAILRFFDEPLRERLTLGLSARRKGTGTRPACAWHEIDGPAQGREPVPFFPCRARSDREAP